MKKVNDSKVTIKDIAIKLKEKVLSSKKWLTLKNIISSLEKIFSRTFTVKCIEDALKRLPQLKIRITNGVKIGGLIIPEKEYSL